MSGNQVGINFLRARALEEAILGAFHDCEAAVRAWADSGRRPPGILDRLAALLRPDVVGEAAYVCVQATIQRLRSERAQESRENVNLGAGAPTAQDRGAPRSAANLSLMKRAEHVLSHANQNQTRAAVARGAMTHEGVGEHWIPSHVDHQARLYRLLGVSALVDGVPQTVIENESGEMLRIALDEFMDGRFAEISLPPAPSL